MSGAMPRVSVIIPACNAAHSLVACLESVRSQSYHDWEAIVVDDASTDDTVDVARAVVDSRVRSVQQESNLGQGAARNRGLEESCGEFVAFLDADDEWKPKFLEVAVGFLDAHPEAIAVSTAFVVRLADGRETVGPKCVVDANVSSESRILERFFDFWAAHDHIRTGTVLIRRSIIERAGPQRADLRVSQDLEYWAYLATFGSWGFVPQPLWVGNSRMAGARGGWSAKYSKRRKLCPTVEAWQERVLQRISLADRDGFETVRGRVAAGYAHNMILGGRPTAALDIVRNYGSAMPRTAMTRLLQAGAGGGAVAWLAACVVIRFKERAKVIRLNIRSGRVRG